MRGAHLYDRNPHQRLPQIHHGYVMVPRSREKVSLPVAAMAQGKELRVRPAANCGSGVGERNHRGGSREDEGTGKAGQAVPRMAQAISICPRAPPVCGR